MENTKIIKKSKKYTEGEIIIAFDLTKNQNQQLQQDLSDWISKTTSLNTGTSCSTKKL